MVKIDENKAASEILSAMEFAYSCEILPRQEGEFTAKEYLQFLLENGEDVNLRQTIYRLDKMVDAKTHVKREGYGGANYYRKA
jgi:hypothetical protein